MEINAEENPIIIRTVGAVVLLLIIIALALALSLFGHKQTQSPEPIKPVVKKIAPKLVLPKPKILETQTVIKLTPKPEPTLQEKFQQAAKVTVKKPAPVVQAKPVVIVKKQPEKPKNPILTKSKQHYTFQLLGTSNEANLKRFIKTNKLGSETYYYHTKRNNKDWYVLIYGDYENKAQASAAKKQLPSKVQKLNPWLRRYADVQKSVLSS